MLTTMYNPLGSGRYRSV